MIDVGKMIAQIRKERGLSQMQLADRLGLTKQAISNYENGRREPDYVTLEAIADELNVPITFLISEEEKDRALKEIYAGYAKAGLLKPSTPEIDINNVAIKAMETLLKYRVSAAPVLPLYILKHMPGVIVAAFTEMADQDGLDRNTDVILFGAEHQDAVTYVRDGAELRYVVAYNQRLPFYMLQRSLAREIGHIVLRHNIGALDERQITEAMYFARYLLCPRPLVRAMIESGAQMTIESVGNITGCYGRMLAGIRKTPGAQVPAELNRRVRALFADYIRRFIAYQAIMPVDPDSALADFGTYMDNYEE